MFITQTKHLEARTARSLDEVTIVSNEDAEPISNKEFERFMLSRIKAALNEETKPPSAVPNAAPVGRPGPSAAGLSPRGLEPRSLIRLTFVTQ